MLFSGWKCLSVFRGSDSTMCKTCKCQSIGGARLNFGLVQIINGRLALICKITISHWLVHVNTNGFLMN